jgi:hypothetical protein
MVAAIPTSEYIFVGVVGSDGRSAEYENEKRGRE